MDMDQGLFQEYQQEETKTIHTQEKHEMTGQCQRQWLLLKALSTRFWTVMATC
jgi:phosphodiesterase/alkaline phosphatase D-like protein